MVAPPGPKHTQQEPCPPLRKVINSRKDIVNKVLRDRDGKRLVGDETRGSLEILCSAQKNADGGLDLSYVAVHIGIMTMAWEGLLRRLQAKINRTAKEITMPAAKKTTAKSTSFDPMTAMNPEMFKESFEKMNKGFEQVAELQKENMDAMINASSTVAGSVEKISSEQAEFTKSSVEDGMKTVKAMAAAKSPQEALDINTEFFRSSFEKNLAQFNKMTEMMVSTGKDAVEPLTDTYNQFVETVQSYRP
ncbi:MAG: phasin family protein [Pseudomonadota bacterium]